MCRERPRQRHEAEPAGGRLNRIGPTIPEYPVTLTSEDTCTIDSFGPLLCRTPRSVSELAAIVREAITEKQAIYPVGGRTMLRLGHPPTRPGYAVDTTRLAQVEDYPARDMTITVEAGISIQRLADILAKENQRLAVDIPLPEQATLGGAIAANASGPRRFGQGTLRDAVIGIQWINDRGEIVKAGGRVVKNVAGYDFMKLHTGALGTLGLISQVTLKLKPLAEASQWLLLPVTMLDVPAVIEKLRTSKTRPTALEVMNHRAANAVTDLRKFDEIYRPMAVLFEDNARAVAWQVEQLRKELPATIGRGLLAPTGESAAKLDAALRDFPLAGDAAFRFKVVVRPSDLWNAFQELSTLNPRPLLKAHLGNGIIHGSFDDSLNADAAELVVERLLKLANSTAGNFTLTECPTAWKGRMPVWGRPTSDRTMMKRIKHQLDPNGLFNPGRYVDGI